MKLSPVGTFPLNCVLKNELMSPWDPTLAAKDAARMGHPQFETGKEKSNVRPCHTLPGNSRN